jgi:hypothetical protein
MKIGFTLLMCNMTSIVFATLAYKSAIADKTWLAIVMLTLSFLTLCSFKGDK